MAEIGVPVGTFTLKVSVWPLISLTVTVHTSAAALGRFAAIDRSIAPASASTSQSLRLFSNVARFLPFAVCTQHDVSRRHSDAEEATDWSGALQR
jgi:hypothetical protein